MDSTPNPNPNPNPNHTFKPSARKLPIKRKTPGSSSNPIPILKFSPILLPKKIEPTAVDGGDDDDEYSGGGDRKRTPPYKFHRIWTEPDEIRFLRGLIDCSSEGLSFPRDLNVFYARFSGAMSQPYTKSQLSEKIRRLRKKFRVISSRLARGLNRSLLSPHDRQLFDLSEQLWHPEFSSASPFGAKDTPRKSNLVGVKVGFSPTLPSSSVSSRIIVNELNDHGILHNFDDQIDDREIVDGDLKLSDVNIKLDDGVGETEVWVPTGSSVELEKFTGKTVLDVFDQCLKETKMILVRKGLLFTDTDSMQAGYAKDGKVKNFEKRWREQHVAEFDVLARRLRLALEHSLQRQ